MAHEFYFGVFKAYEEYYAIAETAEDVKKMLWKMYSFNYYGKPTKEDRETFNEEVYIKKVSGVQAFGYNTAYGETYTTKGNKLIRTDKIQGGAT